MSDQGSKIITTFHERLEIDAALRELAQAGDVVALQQEASALVERFGANLIPPLVAALDTADAQMRGGLGQVAAQLDRGQIEPALRQVAYDGSRPDATRLAAITILERYLAVEPDAAMYAGMADPESMALQSLQEVLAAQEEDPLVLLEYFGQLSFEPEDVLLTMVRSARRLDGAAGVPLLRMFAQEQFRPAAEEALGILGTVAHPAAARALQSLLPTLSPALQPLADRSLQKLRLRGVAVPDRAIPPGRLRCLASPVDGAGNQLLWFMFPSPDGQTCDLLQMLNTGGAGVADASGGRDLPADSWLPAQPVGTVHTAALDSGQEVPVLLEAPFDYGRRRVLQALDQNWQSHRPTPLAYRLFNSQLWDWTLPEHAPESVEAPSRTPDETVVLLEHPAMGGWFLVFPRMADLAREFLTGPTQPSGEQVNRAALALLRQELARDSGFLAPLARDLLAMWEWLLLAGETEAADLAHAAAMTVSTKPESHPFLTRLSEIGMRVAMINLARGVEPVD